jgi:hypothetical protein
VEIQRALARIMNVEIAFPEIAWQDHLAALAAGTADIAAGATATKASSRCAYFSKPYRTDVLVLPRGPSGRYPFHTIEQMLETFAKQKFRFDCFKFEFHSTCSQRDAGLRRSSPTASSWRGLAKPI